MQNAPVPIELRQLQLAGELEISWSDGVVTRYKGEDLRHVCRCTLCRQPSGRQSAINCPADIRILSIAAAGNNAIQICFDDGHDRGIFPWEYLRQLGT